MKDLKTNVLYDVTVLEQKVKDDFDKRNILVRSTIEEFEPMWKITITLPRISERIKVTNLMFWKNPVNIVLEVLETKHYSYLLTSIVGYISAFLVIYSTIYYNPVYLIWDTLADDNFLWV